jgi:hypothetical protein
MAEARAGAQSGVQDPEVEHRSMLQAWLSRSGDRLNKLEKAATFLSCESAGLALVVGYRSGRCLAIRIEPTDEGSAKVSSQLFGLKAYRGGLLAGGSLKPKQGEEAAGSGQDPLPTLELHGIASLDEVAGNYKRYASSAALGGGGAWLWQFVKTNKFDGAFFVTEGQERSVELGIVYAEFISLRPLSRQLVMNLPLSRSIP